VIIGTQPTDLYRLNARVEVKRGTRFFCSAVVGVGNLAVAAFKRLSRWVRQSLIAPLVYRLPASDKKLRPGIQTETVLRRARSFTGESAHLWWRIVLTEAQKLVELNENLLDSTGKYWMAQSRRKTRSPEFKSGIRPPAIRLASVRFISGDS
jgi:hypothetical protein